MNRKWVLVLTMAALIVVTACSGGGNGGGSGGGGGGGQPAGAGAQGSSGGNGGGEAASGAIDPYGPFEETVTINIAQKLPPGDAGLPAGQTVEDNVRTRLYEEELNIKLEREWSAVSGEPYDQKVMLAIASRQLPDAMQVNEEQLRVLVKAGLIEDLSEAFEKYASPKLKQLHYELAEGKSLEAATFDGKLYAIPSTAIEGDAVTVLWLRKDWLDQLGLPEPKTLDDIEAIAGAFVDHNMSGKGSTIGMLGPNTPELANELGNRTLGFDAIFSAYRSFPRHWMKSEGGGVTYGSIEPQTKEALAKLREWYAAGIIDKEFFLRENPNELFKSGQNGLFFGPWWMGWGELTGSLDQNPTAEWKAYAAPVTADGKLVTHMQPVARDFLVVRKGYEHPEALIKGINIRIGLDRKADEMPQHLVEREKRDLTGTNISSTLDIFRVNTDDIQAVTNRRHAILDVLSGNRELDSLEPEVKEEAEKALKYMDDPTVVKYYPQAIEQDGLSLGETGGFQAYVVGGAPLDNEYEKVYSLLYSPTETMKTRWANLTKLEDETFLKIVIGEAPLAAFDDFVKQWRSLGGDTILKEVAAEVGL